MRLARIVRAIVRPDRTLVDPRAQKADLPGGERVAFARHEHVGIETGDEMDERALGTFAGADVRGVIVAALEREIFDIEAEAALLFLRSVTFHAVFLEDRADVLREIHGTRRGWRELRDVHFRRERTGSEGKGRKSGE